MKFYALARVCTVQRLVQYQNLRIMDHGGSHAHSLTHSPGVGPQGPALRILQANQPDGPVYRTEGATRPFWSPDGSWVGFFVRTRLLKVDVGGGAPVLVANLDAEGIPLACSGSWGSDGAFVARP